MARILVFGTSANPPGCHHLDLLLAIDRISFFDKIIVRPCGMRPDKEITNTISPIHRVAMCDLTFCGRGRIELDYYDLVNRCFCRIAEVNEQYRQQGHEVWHFLGTDLVQGGATGQSEIQTQWHNGPAVWASLRYTVCPRQGYPATAADLPPHSVLLDTINISGSSTEIRDRAALHLSLDGFVVPRVADYIRKHNLYRPSLSALTR